MKYKIEKNTVQETLILPLYSRKLCTELYPTLYRDETAVRLIDEIDYDFSQAEKNSRSLMQRFGALEVAMRQNDLAWEVQAYLKTHPGAAVVNLGCGLDNTGKACDNGRCKIYNLDFPDVIALRQQLLPQSDHIREVQIVDLASAVVAGFAGVVQPAAQIDHCCTGVRFQVCLHLPRKVILPHGHLQRTETLHQAAGVFLCLRKVVVDFINQTHRRLIPVKGRIQLGTQLPGIQWENQRLLHGVFLDFVFHRFLPVLLILLSGADSLPFPVPFPSYLPSNPDR